MKKFEGLLKSEIKKVEKFAQKRDGKDSRLTGYDYPETEGATLPFSFTSRTGEDLLSVRH